MISRRVTVDALLFAAEWLDAFEPDERDADDLARRDELRAVAESLRAEVARRELDAARRAELRAVRQYAHERGLPVDRVRVALATLRAKRSES